MLYWEVRNLSTSSFMLIILLLTLSGIDSNAVWAGGFGGSGGLGGGRAPLGPDPVLQLHSRQ